MRPVPGWVWLKSCVRIMQSAPNTYQPSGRPPPRSPQSLVNLGQVKSALHAPKWLLSGPAYPPKAHQLHCIATKQQEPDYPFFQDHLWKGSDLTSFQDHLWRVIAFFQDHLYANIRFCLLSGPSMDLHRIEKSKNSKIQFFQDHYTLQERTKRAITPVLIGVGGQNLVWK